MEKSTIYRRNSHSCPSVSFTCSCTKISSQRYHSPRERKDISENTGPKLCQKKPRISREPVNGSKSSRLEFLLRATLFSFAFFTGSVPHLRSTIRLGQVQRDLIVRIVPRSESRARVYLDLSNSKIPEEEVSIDLVSRNDSTRRLVRCFVFFFFS